MRAELSTIQQTLTPEAASVLNQSIADARRRGHSQTTPLHVAAILLSSPNGFFRQACVQSHPNPSHPLQSRALELCFSVALERVPSSGSAVVAGVAEPPVSNALMAALKRAQAHQRRGCPEQQQQPLLAVKVELEQLVISILDDPSVSRVMREAGFSSPTVKCTIEKTMNNSPNPVATPGAAVFSLRPVPPTNLYMNPRLQRLTGQRVEEVKNSYANPRLQVATDRPAGGQRTDEVKNSYMNPRLQDTANPPDRVKRVDEGKNLYVNPRLQSSPEGGHREEDVKKVINVLQRSEKGNPVLVGDHEPEAVMEEFLQKIESKELGEQLKNVGAISVEKELASLCVGKGEEKGGIRMKIKELGALIESRMGNQDGVILNVGDFRWLVERPEGGFGVSGSGTVQEVVAEVAKLLLRGEKKVWLMGTATCETYLRCQVYHPTLEDDWHLHAVPIAARSPLPGLFTRLGGNTQLGIPPAASIPPLKTSQLPNPLLSSGRLPETSDPSLVGKMSCCTSCMESYETERAKVASDEAEKPSSESKPQETQLPQWLRLAKAVSDSSLSKQNSSQVSKQKSEELQKKWNETCSRLHRGYNAIVVNDKPSSPAASSPLLNSLLSGNILRPEFRLQLGGTNILQLSNNATLNLSQERAAKVTSPVRTELALGRPRSSSPDNVANDQLQESVATRDVDQYNPKLFVDLDADSFKRLFKGLTQKVAWQTDAATTVASVVTKCRSDDPKRKGVGARGDIWLLFVGPDRVGKKKMAEGLSELVFGNRPIYVRLGSGEGGDEDSGPRLWGKTVLDRISDAVRRNPFSVIVLEDVDQADSLTHVNLNSAMETGRLPDSHGRELKLGNVIFILTAGLMPEKFPSQKQASGRFKEDRLAALSACFHPLQLKIGSRNKRRLAWLEEAAESNRKRALTIDLNQSVEDVDLSRDSSDITVETALKHPTPTTAMTELAKRVDKAIAFKVVDFDALSKRIMRALDGKFSVHVCKAAFEIEEEALEHLLAGIWFGQGHGGFDELERWADRVLVPVFRELESGFELKENTVIRLAVVDGETGTANWLPGDVPVTRG